MFFVLFSLFAVRPQEQAQACEEGQYKRVDEPGIPEKEGPGNEQLKTVEIEEHDRHRRHQPREEQQDAGQKKDPLLFAAYGYVMV